MLSHLLIYLFFETVEPSYGTIIQALPEQSVASVLMASGPSLETAPEKTPVKRGESIAPIIEAKSIYSVDLYTGTPLFVRDIFERRQIASIAKLVTAMIILDNHKLDERVIVSRNAFNQEGSNMRLSPGEEITVGDLLRGMLINSGNDAATALAEFDSGSEAAFVSKMNERASALGLNNTHFSNAKGFDERTNYSTAFDTMLFAKAALSYPFIRETVATKNMEVASVNGRIKHKLESTNELLENPYFNVIGLKTGRTPAAGESFVSLVKGPLGHEILTVMLDSPSRFKETKIMIDWVLRNFSFQ